MSDTTPLPATLLTRLSEDSAALLPPPDPSTASMRDYASRRLNSLVPKALRTLEDTLQADPKYALGAATKILDKAPATRDTPSSADLAASLPPEALAAITAGLQAFASVAIQAASAATPIIPDSVEITDALR